MRTSSTSYRDFRASVASTATLRSRSGRVRACGRNALEGHLAALAQIADSQAPRDARHTYTRSGLYPRPSIGRPASPHIRSLPSRNPWVLRHQGYEAHFADQGAMNVSPASKLSERERSPHPIRGPRFRRRRADNRPTTAIWIVRLVGTQSPTMAQPSGLGGMKNGDPVASTRGNSSLTMAGSVIGTRR